MILLYCADILPHLATQLGIKVGKRLIKEQNLRFEYQRAGNGNALLLTTREFARQAIAVTREADEFKSGERSSANLGLWKSREAETVGDIFDYRHVGKQRVGLKHHRDIAVGGGVAS